MPRTIQTLATQYKPRFNRLEPRRNDLRRIGNSPIARASVAMPVLGYLLLFDADLINYLKIHSSFCQNCSVPWRLHMFYFACCCFAIGSVIYAMRCPRTIKSHAVSYDYIAAEQPYFRGPANLEYLFELFEREHAEPTDPGGFLKDRASAGANLEEHDLPALTDLMSQYYFILNRKAYKSRITVFICYAAGLILLAIPSIWTFWQVLIHVL